MTCCSMASLGDQCFLAPARARKHTAGYVERLKKKKKVVSLFHFVLAFAFKYNPALILTTMGNTKLRDYHDDIKYGSITLTCFYILKKTQQNILGMFAS